MRRRPGTAVWKSCGLGQCRWQRSCMLCRYVWISNKARLGVLGMLCGVVPQADGCGCRHPSDASIVGLTGGDAVPVAAGVGEAAEVLTGVQPCITHGHVSEQGGQGVPACVVLGGGHSSIAWGVCPYSNLSCMSTGARVKVCTAAQPGKGCRLLLVMLKVRESHGVCVNLGRGASATARRRLQ